METSLLKHFCDNCSSAFVNLFNCEGRGYIFSSQPCLTIWYSTPIEQGDCVLSKPKWVPKIELSNLPGEEVSWNTVLKLGFVSRSFRPQVEDMSSLKRLEVNLREVTKKLEPASIDISRTFGIEFPWEVSTFSLRKAVLTPSEPSKAFILYGQATNGVNWFGLCLLFASGEFCACTNCLFRR